MGKEEKEKCAIRLLVAGSPNVGKSTFFNTVTGKTVSVANWPGTTVEKKEAVIEYEGTKMCLTDLPGIYNLFSISLEEEITLRELLFGKYDAVIIFVDSLSMTKSLYFAIQVLELTTKAVIALTKFDEAHSHGVHVRIDGLSQALGVQVIPISSITGLGINRLLEESIRIARREQADKGLEIHYPTLEDSIRKIEEELERRKVETNWGNRWTAIKLIEQENLVSSYIFEKYGEDMRIVVEKEVKDYIEKYNRSPRDALINYRYDVVEKLIQKYVRTTEVSRKESSTLEKVMQSPFLSLIFSALIYFGVFFVAFTINTGFPLNVFLRSLGRPEWGEALESYSISGILSLTFSYLASISQKLMSGHFPEVIVSLVSQGIIPGVGSVLSFLPLIMISIAFLGALEDSGLGVRMAIAFDSLLNKFGLTGRSAFPLLLGLGCNIPAVLSTRGIEDSIERKALIYSIPFIPCQARLVIIIAFTAALFSSPILGAAAVTSVYIISILVAMLTARILTGLLAKGREEGQGLIIEIPPLHRPIWRVIWWHVWDNSKHFLKKAGTIILALSVLIWVSLNFTPSLTQASTVDESISYTISQALSPIGKLYGLSEDSAWKTAFMFLNGFIAKESFIEAITLFNPSAQSLNDAVASMGYEPLQAFSILIAATLYTPCLATVATMYSETRSLKGVLLQMSYSILVAIAISYTAYMLLRII
ncbi:MAG: ferrous iron transport protein B [Fervidicoccaceae archaeon]